MFTLGDESSIPRHDLFHVGITIDSITKYKSFAKTLSELPYRPRLRIVFDYEEPALSYRAAVKELSKYADILGEPVDSFEFKRYSLKTYKKRFEEYLQDLGQYVAVWEIANEINGEWCMSLPSLKFKGSEVEKTRRRAAALKEAADEVHEKALVGLEVIRKAKRPTMATYYLNPDCYEHPENEMFTWMKAHPIGADEVSLSYYDDDCSGTLPTHVWEETVDRVSEIVRPGTPIALGECGTKKRSQKKEFLTRYGRLIHAIEHPQWIGGGYWWYGRQDFLPAEDNELLETFVREWMRA